jgi:TolB-like protein
LGTCLFILPINISWSYGAEVFIKISNEVILSQLDNYLYFKNVKKEEKRVIVGVNLINVHRYIHLWKYHNENTTKLFIPIKSKIN